MAHSAFDDLFTVGVLGIAGYLLYNWWTTSAASAAAASTVTSTGASATTSTGTTGAAPAPGAYVPPSVQQQMQTLANSNSIIQAQGGQADAYQWATLWAQAGQPSINDVNTIFFPSGLPTTPPPNASQQGLPLMSLATFLAGLKAGGVTVPGLSGLGQAPTLVAVPVMLSPTIRGKMKLPANTTPAQLQRMLATRRAG